MRRPIQKKFTEPGRCAPTAEAITRYANGPESAYICSASVLAGVLVGTSSL